MLGCKLRSGTLKTKESWGGLVRVPSGHRVNLIYGEGRGRGGGGAHPTLLAGVFFPQSPSQTDLQLYLARPYVHLHFKLVMTCAHFGRDQICTQVSASSSLSGH